uniref:Uncharacterized protein n=1 Tax=Panagrolaimus sp. JU765 TaxID=591449 RepID=A0AC34RLY6_9BILA
MDDFCIEIADFYDESERLTLDIKDFVFFVGRAIAIDRFDFFKSKLLYAINTCALRSIFIKLPTMDQLVKAVNLIPNVCDLNIGLQDENLAVNSNDFEILTRKIGNKTKLKGIYISNVNIPNNWEKICNENFKKLSNLSYFCITKPVPNIPINVIDLYDLMIERNISVQLWNIPDDSFVELPEFKSRFKLQKRNPNQKRLLIATINKSYDFLLVLNV